MVSGVTESPPKSAGVIGGLRESATRILTRRRDPDAVVSRPRLVIVGNGPVGHRLCQKVRELEAFYEVVVFGEEPRPAYDRVHLTKMLETGSPESLELSPRSWYEAEGITLHTGDPVVEIDRNHRRVRSREGLEVAYDRLVLCTGSRAFVPPIEGVDLPGVFVYRTTKDLELIIAKAKSSKTAAVLGGGLLGLEAAGALKDLGLAVEVFERASVLMPRQLDDKAAAILKGAVESAGIGVNLLERVESIARDGMGLSLRCAASEPRAFDMVVVSAGIKPRDELAIECGLRTRGGGGVVVDDHLRTSDDDIFAIGECASHRETVYGLAAPGYQMADVVAANLAATGPESRWGKFEKGDQSTALKFFGIDVVTLGDFLHDEETDSDVVRSDDGAYRKLILNRGRIVGAVSVGGWDELAQVKTAVATTRKIRGWQVERFRTEGRIWDADAVQRVADWADGATVCSCIGVNKGTLAKAVGDGCGTVEALSACTKAGTVCGSCRPLLADLVGAPAGSVKVRGAVPLIAASVVAVPMVAGVAAYEVPTPDTLRGTLAELDKLWTDPFWKQATGWTVAGVTAVSLLLSLRKRVKWVSWGDYGWWRATHSLLGVLTLVGLFAHTGWRLGENLNFWLMATFLATNVAGGFTGVLSGLEGKLSGESARRVRAWRPRLTWLHVLTFWPVPVLLVLHVIGAYWHIN